MAGLEEKGQVGRSTSGSRLLAGHGACGAVGERLCKGTSGCGRLWAGGA